MRRRAGADGQIIVIFALALVALVAMVGLVLDGGSAFSYRRAEQNAADLAALAGANSFLLSGDQATSTATARATASENGFVHGAPGTTVTVSYDLTNGASVTVDITAPHRNHFAGIVGMSTWPISTTATALSGIPDTATGPGPMIFSVDVFGADGTPHAAYGDPSAPFGFGEGNGDVPTGPGDLAWTNYGTGNVNTNEVREMIQGALVIEKQLDFGEYIGQHNNGNHTALYTEVDDYLSGTDVPVPIVDHHGNFQGWATLHITHAVKGEKKVYGYFVDRFVARRLTVNCANGACPRYLGSWELKLTN
jgi:hypothetical protein